MDIVIGSDHGGFDLKETVKAVLDASDEYSLTDIGVFSSQSSDYPKIAHQLAQAVSHGEYRRGILICGSGLGMSIVANRYKGVRAALCHNLYAARMSRRHNDANILVMGPGGYRFVDYIKVGVPLTIVVFITVMFLLPILWPLTPVAP